MLLSVHHVGEWRTSTGFHQAGLVERPIGPQETSYLLDRIGSPVRPICFFGTHIMWMYDADMEGCIGQRRDATCSTIPDKTRILTQVDIGKAIAGPKVPPVAQ